MVEMSVSHRRRITHQSEVWVLEGGSRLCVGSTVCFAPKAAALHQLSALTHTPMNTYMIRS